MSGWCKVGLALLWVAGWSAVVALVLSLTGSDMSQLWYFTGAVAVSTAISAATWIGAS